MKARPGRRPRKTVSHYLRLECIALLGRLAAVRGQPAGRVLEALIEDESRREWRLALDREPTTAVLIIT